MRSIRYVEAIVEALAEEMRRDERVFVMGEDVGKWGGIFRATLGLYDEFGPERVRDAPITEAGIVGAAVGAALADMRPIPEVMYGDFTTICMDQIVNQAAKIRYMFGGQAAVPMVIRTNMGAGRSSAAQHSQSIHAWFMHVPGIKVILPATPYDAKGLLKTAIRDDNPVIYFEHKFLYTYKGEVPEEEYTIPLGVADVKREGNDVTIVALSRMVIESLAAAEQLEKEGIRVEVIDPRTIAPLDRDTIIESVKKTGRAVIVDEGCKTGGVGGEIAAMIVEEAFDYLDAPVARVGSLDLPVAFSPPLEAMYIPSQEKIIEAVKELL